MFKHIFPESVMHSLHETIDMFSSPSVFNISRSGYGFNTKSVMYDSTLIQRSQLTFNEDKHECASTISTHPHQGLYKRCFLKCYLSFHPQKTENTLCPDFVEIQVVGQVCLFVCLFHCLTSS